MLTETNEEGETPLKDAQPLSRKSHHVVPNWKSFRPELHRKTFYNGMNALHLGVQGSVNLKDETARELVKDVFKYVGEDMPEHTIADRMRLRQMQRDSEDYMVLDDMSEDDEDTSIQKPSKKLKQKGSKRT